jgi:hypothetical protein
VVTTSPSADSSGDGSGDGTSGSSTDTDTSTGDDSATTGEGMCVGPPTIEPWGEGDGDGDGDSGDGDGSTGDGDTGDGDTGDGDGSTGDGDGDGSTGDGDGDGDGDGSTGDGDGSTGDGDGDGSTGDGDGDGDGDYDPTEIGSFFPNWQAFDFQPLSCNYERTYGLADAFLGTVTVVVNWRATCGYCQGQVVKFEQLRLELEAEGYDVYFAGLNQVGYDSPDDQVLLTDRGSFPMFQGVEGMDLWALQGGAKDHLYIYDTQGHLADYIPSSSEISTNMSTEEGYANVRNAILAVIGE